MSTECLPKSVKNVQFKKSSYRCTVCKNSFKKFHIYEGHFAFNVLCRAKNGWFIQCYVCGQNFRYSAELKYHIGQHKIQKSKQLKQTNCTNNDRAINCENGNVRENGFECNICKRRCRTKFYLNEHLLSHSKNGITKKTHKNVNPQAKSVIQLPSSAVSNLGDRETRDGLKCETCNLLCTTEISLKLHRKLIHQSGSSNQPKENSLQCEICHAKFTFSCNLKQHRLIHTIGDVECKICRIKFTKDSLRVHERDAHPELLDDIPEENQPKDEIAAPAIASEMAAPPSVSEAIASSNECEIAITAACDITLPPTACEKVGLQCHFRSHHFECYICRTDFPSPKKLVTHMRKHQVFEQWVDPATVYLSNWNPDESREILLNQPLVMVERLNVTDANLTYSVIVDKSEQNDSQEVKSEPQVIEGDTDILPVMNGEFEVDESFRENATVDVKYYDNFDDSPQIIDVIGKTQPDNRDLSTDDDEIMFFEPDTTVYSENVIDISSDSDIDDTELFHCYFCNETFRTLHWLGVHVAKCSFCP